MIGGGVQEEPAVSRIQALGVAVIVTDRDPEAPAFRSADVCVNVDATDIAGLAGWVLLNRDRYGISGLFTLINQAPTVATVAAATGLPGLPPRIVIECDNKLLIKRMLKEADLPTADWVEVSSVSQVLDVMAGVDWEAAYLKVPDGSGGKGIRRLTREDDAHEVWESVRHCTRSPVLILEKEAIGQFIDAQGIFHRGRFYRAGIADSFFSDRSSEFASFNPVETFNVSPSRQPDPVVDSVYELLELSCRRLGIDWGPVGADFVLGEEGLQIIELGARLHGPNGTLQIFPASTGIRPLEFMVQCITGEEPDPELLQPEKDHVALCRTLVPQGPGANQIRFKEPPEGLPGLFAWKIYGNGSPSPPTRARLSAMAALFVVGSTYGEAIERLSRAESALEIVD
jgi:biotin carboxylase